MNQSSDGTDSEGVSLSEDPAKELTDLGPSPPLAILSSRAKSASSLVKIANPGVAVVYYKYESATLHELLKSVRKKLNGRRALSIALLFHGHPGFFKIIRDKSVNLESLREDKEIQKFFLTLVKTHLDTSGTLSRIDLLSCPVAQNSEGKTLVDELGQLLKVPVFTSGDVLGGNVSTVQGSPRSSVQPKIGALYFDEEKLKELVEQTPQNLALYEKLRVVGKGAFGAAVLYKKKDDESLVIIKEINMLDLKKTERALALNEVQVLSIMDHPNIISLYDSFEESGVLMIEMEYADGGTLAQYLNKQEKPLSEPDILNLFKQMVDALRFLHDHRILHRDLKTSNVFLTKEGLIKLGDFGISKVLSATRQEANTVLGTAHYISPEICEGKPYNIKSDVWALGCILHEMACLQKTFDGSNIHAVVNKIVKVIFPPVKGDYTDELKDLIQSMLQKEPDSRPTAEEIQVIRLPQLLERYIPEDPVEEDTTAATHAKSFLYQLEYSKLCLIPVGLPIKERVEQVSLGFSHVVILTMDHFVYSYGEGGRGQLGHGDAVSHHSPKLIESLKEITVFRVDCGAEFSVFSSCNGLIMTCGRGDMGSLGQGDWKDQHKPQLVQGLLNYDVLVVDCGENHVIVLMTDGSIFAWGLGQDGRLGLGNEDNQCSPQMVDVTVRIKDVKCGLDGSMFLTSTGTLLACGSNRYNKLGLNQRTTFRMQVKSLWNKTRLEVSCQLKPSPVKGLTKYKVVDMSLGPTHSAVIVEGGRVVTFGRNSEGQLGCGSMNCKSTPGMVSPVDKGRMMHVACGEVSTIVATEGNFLLFWGSRPLLQSSISNPSNITDADPQGNQLNAALRKRYNSASHTNRPSSSSRNLKNSTSLPDDNLVGDAQGTTPFLLKCRSVNDSNRTLVSEGSQYGHCLVETLEENDAKKTAPNMDANTEFNEWKKVYLTSYEIEFCTETGEVLDLAASDSNKMKVEGITSYGSNLLVLTERQVALAPSNNIIDDQSSLDTTAVGTSSRTPFVMGRRLARNSVLRRMDSRRGLQSPHRSSSREGDTPDRPMSPTMPPLSPITATTDESLEDSVVPSWVEREFQLAQNVLSNLPPAVDSTLAPHKRSLRNEKISLISISQDEATPPTLQRINSSDHIKEGDHSVMGPPVHKQLDRVGSANDFGADVATSKSANFGFPKLNRNLLLSNDKRSYSSGLVENSAKKKTSPAQDVVSPTVKTMSLSRQMDGVRLPPVVSVPVPSLDPKSKVKSMPGGITHVGSTKSFSDITNNIPMPVAALMPPVDGPKSVMRSPPSMFGSSPVMAGKVPPLPATAATQLGTSPSQNIAGKLITSSKQRDVSGIKSDVSLSPTSHEGINTPKTEPKSPSSVYESSPSDMDSTMTTMLMPHLLPRRQRGLTTESGTETTGLEGMNSSSSEGEHFPQFHRMHRQKRVVIKPQSPVVRKPPLKSSNTTGTSTKDNDNSSTSGGGQKEHSNSPRMNRSKAASKLRTTSTTIEEMKSQQAKLQSQLKEFEKKQADYEEELKKAKQETEQAQQNMRHELKQIEDNKKKVEQQMKTSHEEEKKELQISAKYQITRSQETESKLKGEIQELKSELDKQRDQLKQNQEVMKMLQQHLEKLPSITATPSTAHNSIPQSHPPTTNSSSKVEEVRRTARDVNNSPTRNMKSKFCTVM